jgi:hypothetical protein
MIWIVSYSWDYDLGNVSDTNDNPLTKVSVSTDPRSVTRLAAFRYGGGHDNKDERRCGSIPVLLLVPDQYVFVDFLLGEGRNVEPLLKYYQARKRTDPERTEPSALLNHVCSRVIEGHEVPSKKYRHRYQPYEDGGLVPVIAACFTEGEEQILQRGLRCLSCAAVETYGKLYTSRQIFPLRRYLKGMLRRLRAWCKDLTVDSLEAAVQSHKSKIASSGHCNDS